MIIHEYVGNTSNPLTTFFYLKFTLNYKIQISALSLFKTIGKLNIMYFSSYSLFISCQFKTRICIVL